MTDKNDEDVATIAGLAAKRDAMDRVEEHADEDWKQAAARAVWNAALVLPTLTTNDVHIRIDPNVVTHELRALGPVIRNAVRDGWIEKAQILPIICNRPSRHAAPLTVWKSLIYKG